MQGAETHLHPWRDRTTEIFTFICDEIKSNCRSCVDDQHGLTRELINPATAAANLSLPSVLEYGNDFQLVME